MLARWFRRRGRNRWTIDRIHQSIQVQALRPEYYFDGGARDNFSGRFEMTALLATLVLRRLRELDATGRDLAQDVFEALFTGFDEALRDIGTGDLTVGKKIRRMGEAFYGRAKAYEDALAEPRGGEGMHPLERVISRNLGVDPEHAPLFAEHVWAIDAALARHTPESLLAGELVWSRFPGPASRAPRKQNPAGAEGR